MSLILRFEGEGDQIEEMRRMFLEEKVQVSETHPVKLDSKQLSTPWTSPETLEVLKFVTALLQTSAAGFTMLKMIRDAMKDRQTVVVERQDDGAQLKVQKDTSDESLKGFVERNSPPRQ